MLVKKGVIWDQLSRWWCKSELWSQSGSCSAGSVDRQAQTWVWLACLSQPSSSCCLFLFLNKEWKLCVIYLFWGTYRSGRAVSSKTCLLEGKFEHKMVFKMCQISSCSFTSLIHWDVSRAGAFWSVLFLFDPTNMAEYRKMPLLFKVKKWSWRQSLHVVCCV